VRSAALFVEPCRCRSARALDTDVTNDAFVENMARLELILTRYHFNVFELIFLTRTPTVVTRTTPLKRDRRPPLSRSSTQEVAQRSKRERTHSRTSERRSLKTNGSVSRDAQTSTTYETYEPQHSVSLPRVLECINSPLQRRGERLGASAPDPSSRPRLFTARLTTRVRPPPSPLFSSRASSSRDRAVPTPKTLYSRRGHHLPARPPSSRDAFRLGRDARTALKSDDLGRARERCPAACAGETTTARRPARQSWDEGALHESALEKQCGGPLQKPVRF